MTDVHGHEVCGVDVGPETRCDHYATDRDVIAIKFPCCETFFSCFQCHEAVTDHDAKQWGETDSEQPAVLCGVCGDVLTVAEYVACEDRCPTCDAAFNPGCRTHYHYYFADALFADQS